MPTGRKVIREGEISLAQLIDSYGEEDVTEKAAKARKKELREEILEKLPRGKVGNFEGHLFTLGVTKSVKPIYDISQVVDDFTKEKLKKMVTIGAGIKDFVPLNEMDKYIEDYKSPEIRLTAKAKK